MQKLVQTADEKKNKTNLMKEKFYSWIIKVLVKYDKVIHFKKEDKLYKGKEERRSVRLRLLARATLQ